jgi:aminopeptidase N
VSYLSACYGQYPFRWLNVVLLPPNLAGFDASASGPGLVVVQDLDGLGLAGGSAALARSSLELSSGWWSGSMDAGALVTEGLSAAAEVDWLEDTGGDEEALRRREFRRAQFVRALADSGGAAPLSLCLGDEPCQDRRVCRGKGAALFDMLERLVGRDAYCRALALFADRHRGTTTGLRDLVAAFEETAMEDLDWFFYEWIYRGDLPTYAVDYSSSRLRDGRYRVQGTIRQDGEIYRMPVPLTIDLGTWSYDETVAVESSEQPFDLLTETQPIRISVDGDGVIPMIDSDDRARQHFERGNAARAANDWKEAVDEYAAAAFLERGSVAYQKAYGEALVRAGRLTAGVETLERAAGLDPRDAGLRLWLAQLHVRAGTHAAALRHLDAYAAMERSDPIGQTTRALALIGLRRFGDAEAAIASARVLVAQAGSAPTAVEALYVASGRYHEAVGDRVAAARDYERALQANPRSDEARKRLAALDPKAR